MKILKVIFVAATAFAAVAKAHDESLRGAMTPSETVVGNANLLENDSLASHANSVEDKDPTLEKGDPSSLVAKKGARGFVKKKVQKLFRKIAHRDQDDVKTPGEKAKGFLGTRLGAIMSSTNGSDQYTPKAALTTSSTAIVLGDPLVGMCKDAEYYNYPFVSISSSYLWDGTGTTASSCFDFCKELPGLADQVGLTEGGGSCYCWYEAGTLPSDDKLPAGAYPNWRDNSGSGPVKKVDGQAGYTCYPYPFTDSSGATPPPTPKSVVFGDPLVGVCRDAEGAPYPIVYTSSVWDGTTASSCLDFCKSLPGWANQVGLTTGYGYCFCWYEAETAPPRDDLPAGAAPYWQDSSGRGPVKSGDGDSGYSCYPYIVVVLGDPLDGLCIDAENFGYPTVKIDHKRTASSCFDFCMSLPGSANQVGLQRMSGQGLCTCCYDARKGLPSASKLPAGAYPHWQDNSGYGPVKSGDGDYSAYTCYPYIIPTPPPTPSPTPYPTPPPPTPPPTTPPPTPKSLVLGDPLAGYCYDASGYYYPSVFTQYGWDGTTASSCFDFCKELPGLADQVGLITSTTAYCYCLYDHSRGLPSASKLPANATPYSQKGYLIGSGPVESGNANAGYTGYTCYPYTYSAGTEMIMQNSF